jgi:uncharacterized OB-fold protein
VSQTPRIATSFALPELSTPVPLRSGLDQPWFDSVRREQLVIQRCPACRAWQWGPEWVCRACRSFDIGWEEVPRQGDSYVGRIYSWERVWHPTHEALADYVPYVVLLVELPSAGNVRMVGNLIGDQVAAIQIGAPVIAVWERHERYTLVQWAIADDHESVIRVDLGARSFDR